MFKLIAILSMITLQSVSFADKTIECEFESGSLKFSTNDDFQLKSSLSVFNVHTGDTDTYKMNQVIEFLKKGSEFSLRAVDSEDPQRIRIHLEVEYKKGSALVYYGQLTTDSGNTQPMIDIHDIRCQL